MAGDHRTNQSTWKPVGLAADWKLNTTVMPFILRGVRLLGVDSVNCPMAQRQKIWNRLAITEATAMASTSADVPAAKAASGPSRVRDAARVDRP